MVYNESAALHILESKENSKPFGILQKRGGQCFTEQGCIFLEIIIFLETIGIYQYFFLGG